MTNEVRLFYYRVTSIGAKDGFHQRSIPAFNHSEALEKAIDEGIDGKPPEEIKVQKLISFVIATR